MAVQSHCSGHLTRLPAWLPAGWALWPQALWPGLLVRQDGGYTQPSGRTGNALPRLGRTTEWAPWPVCSLARDPNQAELLAELPGQTGPPAWFCSWTEPAAGISAQASL